MYYPYKSLMALAASMGIVALPVIATEAIPMAASDGAQRSEVLVPEVSQNSDIAGVSVSLGFGGGYGGGYYRSYNYYPAGYYYYPDNYYYSTPYYYNDYSPGYYYYTPNYYRGYGYDGYRGFYGGYGGWGGHGHHHRR